MHRIFPSFLLVLFFLQACSSNDETNSPLTQPPYDKLTDSIKLSPKEADLYYRRGGLLYSNNLIPFAEQDIRKAWELEPKEEYALSMTTVLKDKNTDSAIAFLQQALQKLPNSIALQIGLARGYQQKGQLDQALAICEKISNQYPNQIDALVLKSDILQSQNKNQEALTTLEKAYSFAPFDKDLSYDLAYDYADMNNPKALSLADSLIKTDSTETIARAYYIKGTYYNNTGNETEALKNYDAAIAHDYNFLDAYRDKGELYFDKKNYAAALKTFELGLRVSPTTAEFYYWIGKIQEASGDKANARLNYERAYGLDKSMTEAKEAADRLRG